MHVEEYKFGSITILGKTYKYDIEARWNSEVLEWQREKSHIIDIEDVKRAIKEIPELIIIGTGEHGLANVTDNARKEILSNGIGLIINKTEDAVKAFNKQKNKKIIGLFHLTC